MTTFADLDPAFIPHLGAIPSLKAGEFGEACQDIQLPQR